MTLTNQMTRLLAGVGFGAAALVPAVALSPATAAAAPAAGPPCTAGEEIPLPAFDENGNVTGVNCIPCENAPAGLAEAAGCPQPDPDPDPEPDPEPDPDPDPDPDPEPDPEPDPVPDPGRESIDPPVVARPTFTG